MATINIRYPNIHVQLTGADGNAYAILGRVCMALRRAGVGADVIKEFQEEATAGDYNNLLATCMRWVECD
jgi:hypothetical protein